MYAQIEKPKVSKRKSSANSVAQKKGNIKQGFGFVDNPYGVRKGQRGNSHLRYMMNGRGVAIQLKAQTEIKKIAPSAASIIELDNDWGYTTPENINYTWNVTKNNNGPWKMDISKIKGNYSLQARLIPGVSEVTGPTKNSNAGNYANQITDLRALGGVNWHMLNAVTKHEKVHEREIKKSLETRVSKVENAFSTVTAPSVQNQNTAKQTILHSPAFAPAKTNAFNQWDNEYVRRLNNDHRPGGRTDSAERGVVNPMIKKINAAAKKNGWGPSI